MTADTPKPGEDTGTLPEDQRDGAPGKTSEMEIEANPQPEPDSSIPLENDPEIRETEQQPT